MRCVDEPMGVVIKREDLCIACGHTPRAMAAGVLNHQTDRMTWSVDVHLCLWLSWYMSKGLMNGAVMKAEMEAMHGPNIMDFVSLRLI